MDKNDSIYEIDLMQFFKVLIDRWWLIALSAVLCAALAFGYTCLFVTPSYQASVLMYVNNSSISGSLSQVISSGELTAANSLVKTYCTILTTRLTLEEVIERAGVDYTYGEMLKMISASDVNGTAVFRITVTDTDPEEACKIANTITEVLPDKISDVVEGSRVKTVDLAVVPRARSSPSYSKNTAIGMAVGIALGVCAILLFEFLNDTVQSEDWVLQTFKEDIPLLAVIPDVTANNSARYGKYKYGYGYGPKSEKQ